MILAVEAVPIVFSIGRRS